MASEMGRYWKDLIRGEKKGMNNGWDDGGNENGLPGAKTRCRDGGSAVAR